MSNNKNVYLDYAASTPVDSRVVDKMLPYFTENYGNSGAVHRHGQEADAAIERSRRLIAEYLNCSPNEIIFTSGGTESNNLALRGAALAAKNVRNANHILISPVEHHSVSETATQLEEYFGFEVEFIPIDEYGIVDIEAFKNLLRPSTAIVSVIHANNEIGSINPISEIGKICRSRNIPFHTDSVQAAAHIQIDLSKTKVDLLSIGAHKFNGPKGVGALYIKTGTEIIPTQTGGGQENGLRSGTPNTPYIVGLAEALIITNQVHLPKERELSDKRDFLIDRILAEIPESKLTGHPAIRLSNNASFVFRGMDGNMLLQLLDNQGFSCSSGSACMTGDPEPSEVLLALRLDPIWAFGSLRVSIGHATTQEQLDSFCDILPAQIETARTGIYTK